MTREIDRKIGVVCEVLGEDKNELLKAEVREKGMQLWARFILTYELTKYGMKKSDIGSFLGKDRSMVRYYLKKYADEYATCQLFRDLADEVKLIRYIPYMPVG